TGADNAAQTNDFSIAQAADLENNCDEFEEGTNSVFCNLEEMNNDIEVDAIYQSNEALGSADAVISQNNQIDGDDALGIPGISQFIQADNTCGQTGAGDNLADCQMFSNINAIVEELSQSNSVADADDGTVISQDNGLVISQALELENDCDENTFSGTHDNNAICLQDEFLDNDLEEVSQVNEVEALDNSISDQGNNVAISQDLLADNDCNGTGGNDVHCTNDGFDLGFGGIDDFNFIDIVEQGNSASLTGDVSSVQLNDAGIDQGGALVNTCDETDGGVNSALCVNVGDINILGPIAQFNTVSAPNSDTALQSNVAQVTQNLQGINDCDEAGTGFNFAVCANEDNAHNEIDSNDAITQTNDAIVGDDTVQSNFVGVNQDLQLENLCDETGLGDNGDNSAIAICSNEITQNNIGPVDQANAADGSGDADFTQNNNIPSINQVISAENDCDQSDEQSAEGDNIAVCTNDIVSNNILSLTQSNDADATHVDDIFQDNIAAFSQILTVSNGCDATTFSTSGDNAASCSNDFTVNFIGPVDQENIATGLDDVLIDQDNNVAVSQALSANNDCDATGSNFADCFYIEAFNGIDSITQTNDASGNEIDDISQGNDAVIDQNMDLLNSCDETGDGNDLADCFTVPGNRVEPLIQTNTATGDDEEPDTTAQSNVVQITQNLDAVNDCDEENTGANLAECVDDPFNSIKTITQTNDGIVGDDLVQFNFVGINQNSQTENTCDETGLGDNDAECDNGEIALEVTNHVGPINQFNSADGSGAADFTQNNNIPTINQVVVAENDCDQSDEQSAGGNNEAFCSNSDTFNDIDSITQSNDADATHVDDIFQDNQGTISQVMILDNDCDATTFTDDGDNFADCHNDEAANLIGPVGQTNTATGLDDVLINQDNNVAVSQDLSANNDCDATATNLASCDNDNVQNFIDSITQSNSASGDGFATISQNNEATIAQNMDLLNSCNESGAGINDATCSNDDADVDAENFIGPIVQTNTATGDASDTFTQSNVAQITQNLQGTNDCDEANTGDNLAECNTNISNNIESITQTNLVNPAAGTQVEDQSNFLGINQNLVATNDCDETGNGDNNAVCTINQSNDIGAITQSNTASSNVLNINQDGQATNNCDDTTSGDNDATCTIDLHLVVPDITQTGDETLNIDQHENLVNTCPGTGTCSISITRTFDPNAIQALLASTTSTTTDSNSDEEDEEETGSQALTLSSLKTAQADTDTSSALTVNNDDDKNNADDNTETDDDNSGTSTESTEKAESDTRSDTNTVTEGQDNTGDDNTGDDNTGDDDSGDGDTGDDDSGDGDNKDSGDDDS
ncbi:MAG TPA: hypothetical protein VL854_14475, partial [Nitrososphaeraceae archaeon]|nr:hypothetical protein [Nitrososphaeraceae archaeon]